MRARNFHLKRKKVSWDSHVLTWLQELGLSEKTQNVMSIAINPKSWQKWRNTTTIDRGFRDRPQSSAFGSWLEFSQPWRCLEIHFIPFSYEGRHSCAAWIRIQKSSKFWSVQMWGFDSVPSVTACGEEEGREIVDVIHKSVNFSCYYWWFSCFLD